MNLISHPKVVFVDDSEDLRLMMIHLMKKRYNEDCSGCASLQDVVVHENEVLTSKIVVLDVNLGHGQPDGFDVFNWLQNHSYSGNILFLTGHAKNHPRVKKAWETGVPVLEKPINPGHFTASLKETLHGRSFSNL